MKIVFEIRGGIGKSVAATAVCKAIKTQYPSSKLIVITGYPPVFEGNRNVFEVRMGHEGAYFYRDHIMDQEDTIFFLQEPYIETDFIHRRGHLIKVWCEMNGIKYNGEMPEIFLNYKEKSSFGALFRFPKPIFLIQTNGGMPNKTDKYSWPRDMPFATAQKVVDAFLPTHTVIHIRRNDQPTLKGAIPIEASFRHLAVLIAMSDLRLFIDSFAQHTAAGLGMPSVVFWVANVPSQFGYELHDNIIANPPTLEPELRYAGLSKYNTNGPEKEFPYNDEEEIIEAEVLIVALKKYTKTVTPPQKHKPPQKQNKKHRKNN